MHFSPMSSHSQRAVFEHMNHGPVPVRGAEQFEPRQFDDPRQFQSPPRRQQNVPLQPFDDRAQRPPAQAARNGGQPLRNSPPVPPRHHSSFLGDHQPDRPQPGSGQLVRPAQQAASSIEDDAADDEEFEAEEPWSQPQRHNRPQQLEQQTFRQTGQLR